MRHKEIKSQVHKVILLIILLLAIFFRFQNMLWDQGLHLHPDERFLTMVGVAMKLPQQIGDYFNPHISSLNPANIGFGFFVYGVFPVILNKLLALLLRADTYDLFSLLGRGLTAGVDVLTTLCIYQIGLLLEKHRKIHPHIKWWGSFIYAISVLPIQYAHFFTTDAFLTAGMMVSLYISLLYYFEKKIKWVVLCAVIFGLTVASKINAFLIFPLLLYFMLHPLVKEKKLIAFFAVVGIFVTVLYFSVRIANPYYFEKSDLFDPTPSSVFIQNIQMLKSFEGKDVTYPPALQWVNTGPLFPLFNIALFGLGMPAFIALCMGGIYLIRTYYHRFFSRKQSTIYTEINIIFFWSVAVLVYQSFQFVKVMRYFIFLYPIFALVAGIGITNLLTVKKKKLLYIVCISLLLIWPVIFSSIYFTPHTRVAASKWLLTQITKDTKVASEYWDDPIPLPVGESAGGVVTLVQIPIFDPESPDKWQKVNEVLHDCDYFVLSSNRGWGSMPTIPDRYKQTADFYDKLFNGKTEYKLVKAFYPSYYLCGTVCPRILSNVFDESFTVYDHPTVYIFKHEKTTP